MMLVAFGIVINRVPPARYCDIAADAYAAGRAALCKRLNYIREGPGHGDPEQAVVGHFASTKSEG